MWHMDGQFPSRFTWSTYEKETTTVTPHFEPKCLYDIMLAARSLDEFFSLLWSYPWTILVWYI